LPEQAHEAERKRRSVSVGITHKGEKHFGAPNVPFLHPACASSRFFRWVGTGVRCTICNMETKQACVLTFAPNPAGNKAWPGQDRNCIN
jgi:hypothetical protein